MKAVDTHADLLRQSASNVGNDHRLGGYEAPPAIISIFLGEQLEDVVAQLVETGKADNLKEGGVLRTGVSTLPDFVKDATDRNVLHRLPLQEINSNSVWWEARIPSEAPTPP